MLLFYLSIVLGRNCRFLQGPDTDPNAVAIIRRGIKSGADTSVCLLNYRKDGTTFWNQFFICGLRNNAGTIVNFIGVQCVVSSPSSASRQAGINLAAMQECTADSSIAAADAK
jgi:hypothetical protein